ncbi:MAG: hypothetical protein BWY54_01025 [Candidatus Dependentiae bacterium ADurb.Bin331]|nr:MAG: hypothetical protein BWY54_01025 [Candidatus Dependentiae bacterium ADurb.Bin331]
MNKIEKELKNCIEATERMSGWDGSDSEGDMSYFDDDDMSYFDDDDMSYAQGPNASSAQSDPYVIQYFNTVAVNATCYLFGYNDFFGVANYGNPATVTITNLQGGTYGRLIAQSNNKFFKIGKWRFQSSTPSQLQQTLQIFHVDGNGKQYSSPMNLSILKDAYQQQTDIIDVTKNLTIDGNTYLQFTLIASATLVISMFPTSVLSGKAKLNGGNTLNKARAPRLSGKNVAPVIIQTSQGVAGITKK